VFGWGVVQSCTLLRLRSPYATDLSDGTPVAETPGERGMNLTKHALKATRVL
jgi:hypothetical protein